MVRTSVLVLSLLFVFCVHTQIAAAESHDDPARSQVDTTQLVSPQFASSDTVGFFGKISDWASSNWVRPGTTKLERISWVIGASLLFSLFDYVVFHMVVFADESGKAGPVPFSYRIAQSSVQAGLSYLLYDQMGLSSTVAFNTIWWTWGDDLAFYGWLNLINAGAPWYNRSFHGFQGNQVTWAGWTPVGITRPQGTVISKDVLIIQSVIGFSIAMYLN